MQFDLDARTIFLCRHGSHAYGLNTAESDEDFKGVCIPPRECYLGFTQKFEQFEHMGSKSDGIDKVVYALSKFVALAANANPNIIEVLHVADEDVLKCDRFGEVLRSHKDDFLSKKARWTFSGYMMAQIKRIKTHRNWLLDPPVSPPERKNFGLGDGVAISKSELGAFDSLLDLPSVDDRMPVEQVEVVNLAARDKLGIELPRDIITRFTREKAYQAAKTHYDQYTNWKKTRNSKRAEIEAKFGYDCKHAYHVIRLGRMCIEILEQHKVIVKRPDREELMTIRNGAWSYERLLDEATKLDERAGAAYEISTLRHEPNRVMLDKFVVDLTERYLRLYG